MNAPCLLLLLLFVGVNFFFRWAQISGVFPPFFNYSHAFSDRWLATGWDASEASVKEEKSWMAHIHGICDVIKDTTVHVDIVCIGTHIFREYAFLCVSFFPILLLLFLLLFHSLQCFTIRKQIWRNSSRYQFEFLSVAEINTYGLPSFGTALADCGIMYNATRYYV